MLSKFEEEEEAKKNAEKERVEKEVTAVDDTNNVPQQSRRVRVGVISYTKLL